MKTVIKVDLVFVLLLSLFVFSSYGANTRRGIGGAIIGGIIDTQKAIIHGITDTVGAAIETGKKSRNATETGAVVRSSGLLEDDSVTDTVFEEAGANANANANGGMSSTGEEHYDDGAEVPAIDETISDSMINDEEEGVFSYGNEMSSPADEGSGMFGEMSADEVTAGEEAFDGGVEFTSTDEQTPSFNAEFITDSNNGELEDAYKDFQSGSEGRFGRLAGPLSIRKPYHYRHDRHDHDDSDENDDDDYNHNDRRDERDIDCRRKKYNHHGDSDSDDDDCRKRRYHNHGDYKEYNYDNSRHYNQRIPRRLRRDVGSAIVGGIGNTANSVASGIENTVDAAVTNKTDGSSSKETGKTKASGIGGAIVGGISNTANTVAEGIEDTVDAAKETANTTTAKSEEKSTPKSACKFQDICYGDSDCNGGKCVGTFVGTCNCNACFNFMTCTSDEGCGGLKGACDMNTKRCNCHEAQRKLGFASYFDALAKFCNHQSCNATSDSCNGLPCSTGRCFC